jgi:hypothetical protein
MLKYCVEQWEKNKENLRQVFEKVDIYSDYEEFARIVIENIFPKWESYEVAITKQGDYTGDVIFFISADTEGSKNDIFLSYLRYGSCSVCDTLMRAAESEEKVEDQMRVALHFIQNMKHPFSNLYCPSKYDECCQ